MKFEYVQHKGGKKPEKKVTRLLVFLLKSCGLKPFFCM